MKKLQIIVELRISGVRSNPSTDCATTTWAPEATVSHLAAGQSFQEGVERDLQRSRAGEAATEGNGGDDGGVEPGRQLVEVVEVEDDAFHVVGPPGMNKKICVLFG